jgi:hypothetical protein
MASSATAGVPDFSRQVIVSGSSLHRSSSVKGTADDGDRLSAGAAAAAEEFDGGETYIDPSLMLSQQTYMERSHSSSLGFRINTATPAEGSATHGRHFDMGVPSVEAASENDLNAILSQMKGGSKPARINLSSQSGGIDSRTREAPKKSIFDTFMDMSNQPSANGGSRSSSDVASSGLSSGSINYASSSLQTTKNPFPTSASARTRDDGDANTVVHNSANDSINRKPIKKTFGLAKAAEADFSFCASDLPSEQPPGGGPVKEINRKIGDTFNQSQDHCQRQNQVESIGGNPLKREQKKMFKEFVGMLLLLLIRCTVAISLIYVTP